MTFEYINENEFKKLKVNNKIKIIDIRTDFEYKSGHIENAQNINFQDEDFPEKINNLDKKIIYLIYCRSGGRVELAKKHFKDFEKIYILENGLLEYTGKLETNLK